MSRTRRAVSCLVAAGLLAALAVVGAGCSGSYPAPPTQVLRPTVVGIIDSVTIDTAVHTRLNDGRIIDQPLGAAYTLLRVFGSPSWGEQGWLLLADPRETGFTKPLPTWSKTEWEIWQSGGDSSIAWDEGDSILFADGVELQKAKGFFAEEQPQTVDGRSAWIAVGWGQTLIVVVDADGHAIRLEAKG